MKAEGSDGRSLQLRGGGVVRMRPDGTGLELYSRGTRNILEVSLDPLLNGFARDNTNDGGGWDIRLHHFSGLENHGYPTRYINFPEEIIQPLTDYGGGSGCGGLYLHEPGFPDGFGDALYTADWGREIVYRHPLKQAGATFEAGQEEFLGLPRVTDLDVDAMSRIVASSWHGGMYNYGGEDVGFLLQLRPANYTPDALPEFATLDDLALCDLLRSPSHRRRLEAQRTLLRREMTETCRDRLVQIARDTTESLQARTAAMFTLKQALGADSHAILAELAEDSALRSLAIRATTDRANQLERIPLQTILRGLTDDNARTRLESVVAIARLQDQEQSAELVPRLDDDDAVVRHTTIEALVQLDAADTCLAVWDHADSSELARQGALRVLQSLHQTPVVEALIARMERETDGMRQRQLFAALARLHNQEGLWRGNSWGTRPDTRGPYYQPEPWESSPAIATALAAFVEQASTEQTGTLANILRLHRLNLDAAFAKLLDAAKQDATLLPVLVAQLAAQDAPPPSDAIALLVGYVSNDSEWTDEHSAAAEVLLKSGDAAGFRAVLKRLAQLGRLGPNARRLRDIFFDVTRLEPHCEFLLVAAGFDVPQPNRWADAAVAKLAHSDGVSPENRAQSQAWVEERWKTPAGRIHVLRAISMADVRAAEVRVRQAVVDADPEIQKVAQQIAERWNLTLDPVPSGPAIKTLVRDEVLSEVTTRTGDAAHGEAVFNRIACNKCHTVREDEPLRGPYLANVVKTFPRAQLAEAILVPGKSIAQGFVTNVFILHDGRTLTGFVTREADDAVTIRDGEGKESVIPVNQIEERVRQETVSLMPEGLVDELSTHDLASLLDYLQSLAE
jgi:putative heme-binding domain-containing protein